MANSAEKTGVGLGLVRLVHLVSIQLSVLLSFNHQIRVVTLKSDND